MDAPYEHPAELAKAIKRARTFRKWDQARFALELGKGRKAVISMEQGKEGSLGETPNARRATAIVVQAITGAPRDWFGLSAPDEDERLVLLQRQLDAAKLELSRLGKDLTQAEARIDDLYARLESESRTALAEGQLDRDDLLRRLRSLERRVEVIGTA